MATALQVIGRLAALLGLLPSTLERQLRAQRLAGQLPTGRPGGGRVSAHFEAQHFANVILGLAGAEPSDAPDAAVALRAMSLQDDWNPPPGATVLLPTLEDQLAEWLDVIAEAYRRGGQAWDMVAATLAQWEMSLCLRPRQAVIAIGLVGDPTQRVISYGAGDDEARAAALRRVTVLHGELMLAAGELLADSTEQIKAIAAIQPQPAKAGAEQEKENAGCLRQEAPAPLHDQPRANGTDRSSNTPDGSRVERALQAPAGHPPIETGRDQCPMPTMMPAS